MGIKKFERTAVAAGVALFLGAVPLAANGSVGPKTKPSTLHPPRAVSHTVTASGHGSAAATSHGSTTHGPQASHAPKTTSPPTTHGNPHGTTNTSSRSKTGGTKGTTTSTTGTTATMTASKAQELLAKNTNLRTKLQSRLPAGTDINVAAAGFRNLGQFVAAVNVSNNLGIPFADLKAKMTGTTPVSLGQAIQQLKGTDTTTANHTAQTALTQANIEVGSTSVSTSTTTNTTTATTKAKKTSTPH